MIISWPLISGYETARSLSLHGAHVVLACRNPTKAYRAMNAIKKERPQANVEVMILDLACLSTVTEFANSYRLKNWSVFRILIDLFNDIFWMYSACIMLWFTLFKIYRYQIYLVL